MALKFIVETLDGLPSAVRDHYTAKDGKYQLTLDGGHPDTARIAEFRTNNLTVTRERDDLLKKLDGIDLDAVKADRAKLAEFEKAKPTETIAALQAELADAKRRANGAVLKDAVVSAFLKAGGRTNAADFILAKAADKFIVENGAVVGIVFDPAKPGEKLSVDAFITQQIAESDFAFRPSGGGGANPLRGAGGALGGAKELRNPTPHQLGEAADAIKRGDVRVVYDN